MIDWLRRLPEPAKRPLRAVFYFSRRSWRRTTRWWRRTFGPKTGRSRMVQIYEGFVPGFLKARLSPVILDRRRRRAARRRAALPPDELWARQRRILAEGSHLTDFAYFPGGIQNPYLRLLYARVAEAGFDARPLGGLPNLDPLGGDSAFHLHWTRVFQVGVGSEKEARTQSGAQLKRIEEFVGRGGRLLWSVHEVLPHDCAYPEVEVELRRRLVELASGVHVLHASTSAETEAHYVLDPDKTFVVEHPLYANVYPDYVPRSAARRLLGIGDDEVLLLGFGAIRPYKGFDRLVEAVPRLRAATGLEVRVMVAGPTYKAVDNAPLLEAVEATEGASLVDVAVPDEYVQVLFRAADVAVLPYRKVLNSGVLMLALTFGCPSVAPRNPVTADTVESGLVHLFDSGSSDDLDRAVAEAVARRGERGLSADYAARYDHEAIAGQFADEVAARLRGEDST
jgi:glycosyltransferase involved in cell wall biosynthesis